MLHLQTYEEHNGFLDKPIGIKTNCDGLQRLL